MSLFILIPCYNAENSIHTLFQRIKFALKDAPPYTIICVNDGSYDQTVEKLNSIDVQVIHHKKNLGKGAALKTGYTFALENNATSVLTLDSDLQHDPNDIQTFLAASSTADIIIGSRKASFTQLESEMPFLRQFSNRTTSRMMSRLTGQVIEDAQCGFRLINKICLKTILPLCSENGYMFETEFLILASQKGFKVQFVPIQTIYGVGKSYMRPVRETINFLKLYFRHCQ
ncbi:MAG: glycosyltransferase family 2 protein [Chloroherpetonaceae bacterium]|nr:glycosyltransferase family 2 protein [Chloroherpetonaceae bacterium]